MSPTLKSLLFLLPFLLSTSTSALPNERRSVDVPATIDCKDENNKPAPCACKCDKPGWTIQGTINQEYSLDCHGPLPDDASYGPIGWKKDLSFYGRDCLVDRPDYKALNTSSLGPDQRPPIPAPVALTPDQRNKLVVLLAVCGSEEAMGKLEKGKAEEVKKVCDGLK
ncbi:MAG: hypothetical protein Q9182_003900 [Xanthomendoza sp. 2 TL-2023]